MESQQGRGEVEFVERSRRGGLLVLLAVDERDALSSPSSWRFLHAISGGQKQYDVALSGAETLASDSQTRTFPRFSFCDAAGLAIPELKTALETAASEETYAPSLFSYGQPIAHFIAGRSNVRDHRKQRRARIIVPLTLPLSKNR